MKKLIHWDIKDLAQGHTVCDRASIQNQAWILNMRFMDWFLLQVLQLKVLVKFQNNAAGYVSLFFKLGNWVSEGLVRLFVLGHANSKW